MLPLGVIAQAVLGGLTVKGELDYGWVMAHFALSMLILVAAGALVWRARNERSAVERRIDRTLVWWGRALVGLGALTIFAGTAATAAGPHAGGSPGQKINRLDFDGRGTMDFVIHRHGEIALVFGLLAVWVWWLTRGGEYGRELARASTSLCVLIALQGLVGLDQYETHLPTELVWVHVTLACLCWLATLWTGFAAGSLTPEKRPQSKAAAAPSAVQNVL
jgi:cytochrome c oxidase assembly protein subunit 15